MPLKSESLKFDFVKKNRFSVLLPIYFSIHYEPNKMKRKYVTMKPFMRKYGHLIQKTI